MTIPQMFDRFFLWLSEHQATALWIFIGAVVVILGVLWSSKKAREGLVAFARLLLTTVWGIIFLVLFPIFACILIGVIAMLQGLGPWTICKIDNIVNDRSFLAACAPLSANTSTVRTAPQATQPPAADAVPAATQGYTQTFTTGGAYVVSLPSGATVRDACSSTATELGTLPTKTTVTLSTPVDSNCVDNVCQRAVIESIVLPYGWPDLGFDPVGGCIHMAAVNPQ